MLKKLTRTRRELKELQKRVKNEKTLSPEERALIREIVKEAERTGLITVKK
jgi:hypothetical protein